MKKHHTWYEKEEKKKNEEMTEDNSRDTDHHHTPEGAPSLSLRGLATMHGIHPQVVPHRLTGFTASRLDPSQATPGVCDGQTVPHFLSLKSAALTTAPPLLLRSWCCGV